MVSSFCSSPEQHRTRHKLPRVSGWAPRKWRAALAGTAGCVKPGLHWQSDPGATVTPCTPRRSLALALKAKIKLSQAVSVLLSYTGLRSRPGLVISYELRAVLRCAHFPPSGNTRMQLAQSVRAHQVLLLLSCRHPGCSLQCHAVAAQCLGFLLGKHHHNGLQSSWFRAKYSNDKARMPHLYPRPVGASCRAHGRARA